MLIHRTQHTIELKRPTLSSLRTVLRRSEGVICNEDLLPCTSVTRPQFVRAVALVNLSPIAQRSETDHLSDGGLSHLGGPDQRTEVMPLQHGKSRVIRVGWYENPRQLKSSLHIHARTSDSLGSKQIRRRSNAQNRRNTPPQLAG